MSTLTLPDEIVIEPVGDVVTGAVSRRVLGRRLSRQITLRGIVEYVRASKQMDGGTARDNRSATLYLDPRDCDEANWEPAHGDRLVQVTWNDNGRVQPVNLYLDQPEPIGAGGVYRIALRDRSPGRVTA